jgi:hypothetical protein
MLLSSAVAPFSPNLAQELKKASLLVIWLNMNHKE